MFTVNNDTDNLVYINELEKVHSWSGPQTTTYVLHYVKNNSGDNHFLASQYYVYRNARQTEPCTSGKRWFDIQGVYVIYIYVSQMQEVPKLENYNFLYKI